MPLEVSPPPIGRSGRDIGGLLLPKLRQLAKIKHQNIEKYQTKCRGALKLTKVQFIRGLLG